ncbi:MAG: carbohydrate porin [Phycisphaerales bacterium]|nr:carbohydrate porin [Phycisphaerales bacterium]
MGQHAIRHSGVRALIAGVLACAGAAQGQQEPPPPPPPPPIPASTSPPADTAQESPTAEPDDYSGHPREASVGGRERKLPEHAGLFPWSPLSLIEPPIKGLKDWTSKELRLDLGFRAAFFFQQATGGPGERTAASQDYRVYGTFHVFNWEEEKKGWAGNVYFRAEYRDKMFTDIPPYDLNTQIGTLFTTAYGQDEHDFAMVQLFYEQFLFDGDLRLRLGKIDPDDYFDLGRFADDYRYFSNTLFSAFPSANHPSGGLGWNAQWYITPEWTLTGGMSDVRGRKVWPGWETVNDGRFISAIDVTYSPDIEGMGKGNYRLGFEHRASFPNEDRPQDNSVYFNVDQEVAKDIAPFFRFGYGTGNSTAVEYVTSVGLGIDNAFSRPGDAFGVGVGFDTPDDAVVSPRDIEYAGEIFYRFQLTHAMQWTIGGQLILDPILAPDDDAAGVFEMRLVIDF